MVHEQELICMPKKNSSNISNAYKIIFNELSKNNDSARNEIAKELLQDLENIKTCAARKSSQEFCLSDKSLQKCYEIAQSLFEQKNYTNALEVFMVLIKLNPTHENSWLSLGIIYQIQKNWLLAINAYKIVVEINDKSPLPYFHMAQIFLNLGDMPEMQRNFEDAMQAAEGNSEWDWLKQHASQVLSIVRKAHP